MHTRLHTDGSTHKGTETQGKGQWAAQCQERWDFGDVLDALLDGPLSKGLKGGEGDARWIAAWTVFQTEEAVGARHLRRAALPDALEERLTGLWLGQTVRGRWEGDGTRCLRNQN